VKYEILGPLRVTDGDNTAFISARKIEVLLAVLLIRADRVVPAGGLIAEIWGGHAPRRATAGLQVYISQLRKFLWRPGRDEGPIVTRPPGYLLSLGPDELDLHTFQRLADLGRTYSREGRHEEAGECFQKALALHRGPLLDDVRHGPIVEGFATWLVEARLECIEMLVESQLQLGRHRELVARLYTLTAEYPMREVFYRQLMLALYRSERQADALRVYQMARRTLREELGLEPCSAVQNLQRAILAGDPALDSHLALVGG
jgi:DNA-binding SARP family transcriptional activator